MSVFHKLVPGQKIPGDWFDRAIPQNIDVGDNCKINSAHSFINYFSTLPTGMTVGEGCVFYQTSFAVEEKGYLKIGSECYIANASLVVSEKIEIGNRVFIAGGVTIVDSNFHPLDPAQRLLDIQAISPGGDRSKRPPITSHPVLIEDDVWIGYNATIMSGVTIGKGAVIQPGAVVLKSVEPYQTVAGNPAAQIV